MIVCMIANSALLVKAKANTELVVGGNDIVEIENTTCLQTDTVHIVENGTLVIRNATLKISEDFGVSIEDRGKILLENGNLTGRHIEMTDHANLTAINYSNITISELTGIGNCTVILSNYSILDTSGVIDFSDFIFM